MPNLSYQMQLMNAAQQQPMRNLDALLNTAGGVFQRSEARTDEMDAVNYFIQKEDISPEDMRDFKTTHPRMPDADIWKIAGRIGTQKKAQKAKDFVKTIGSLLENGEELNEETIGRAVKNSGLDLAEAMKVIETGAKSGLNFKQAKAKNRFVTIGGRGVLDTETNQIIGAPEPERPYKLGQKIDVTGPDGTEYEGWVGGYDENGQVKFDKLVKKAEKTGKVDKVKVYGINGNLIRLATPEADGTVTLKPGETTQEPRGTSLLSPAEEAQKIRISKASRDDEGRKYDRSDRIFAANLRREFNALPEVKEANMIVPKLTSMEAAFKESKKTNNFVAVDQALITLFNKLTDPQSVVRESEYARTAMNIPLLNVIKGKAQKVLEGGAGLTQAERAALITMARLMKKGYDDIKGKRLREYRGYAATAGLNPEETIGDAYGSGAAGGGTIKFTSNGRTYNIPAAREAEFLKDHPTAQRTR